MGNGDDSFYQVILPLVADWAPPKTFAGIANLACASGLVFYDQPNTASSVAARVSALYYILQVFQLLPFSFMTFFISDRQFFLADVKSQLYSPSAYFAASCLASKS